VQIQVAFQNEFCINSVRANKRDEKSCVENNFLWFFQVVDILHKQRHSGLFFLPRYNNYKRDSAEPSYDIPLKQLTAFQKLFKNIYSMNTKSSTIANQIMQAVHRSTPERIDHSFTISSW